MRNVSSTKRAILPRSKAKSVAHDIVVVREANKKSGIELDPDIQRLQVSKNKKLFRFQMNHNDENRLLISTLNLAISLNLLPRKMQILILFCE